MATRSDSGEYIVAEKNSISGDEFAEDSPKIVSVPSLKNDSVGEISPEKQVKSSPCASVSEKDGEITHLDSVEVSFSETSSLISKEPEAMDVDCPGVFSGSILEENRVGEELQLIKETYDANISEISTKGDRFGDDVHKMEEAVDTDGCVVSISEIQQETVVPDVKESLNSEKKGQDDDAQRLLEAEKRRLLAEIEVGTIFGKKADEDMLANANEIVKNGNGSKEQHEETERVIVKDNAFVGRSMKIDLVDDTALLNVVPFYKKGKDHPKRPGTAHTDKDAPRKHKKIGEKPVGGKQDKGNASNASTKVSKFDNHGETSMRIMYTRKQMESMRYAHIARQKKLWSDMYATLLPELVNEYEGLASLKNHKISKSSPMDSGIGILGTKKGMDDLTLEEEEYTEDIDDYTSILRPAFAVDGEPDFDSGEPEDGFEYLRRVRWEAKRVPNVKVAKIDETKYIKQEQSVYMPQIPEIPKCPEHLLPVKEWEDSLLSDFLHLRLALSPDASESCEDEMMTSPSVEDVLMEIFSKRLHTEIEESFGGVVSEIQGMDSVTRVSRLKKRIGLVEKESGLESSDFKWVVALCASVDTPLDADTCACLRALLRKCASLRAFEVEDEQVIIMANMLITIAGRFFGQME
uniref:Gem-associated protein 2 n=1 Tax=Noccaea caerulescens TaxID=107243 RepID=A0A1J3JCF1_NOCCA